MGHGGRVPDRICDASRKAVLVGMGRLVSGANTANRLASLKEAVACRVCVCGALPETLGRCIGLYDEATLVGMDYVLQQASLRGIRLVLVLANYWAMYGGIDQYNIWSFQAGSGARCGPASRGCGMQSCCQGGEQRLYARMVPMGPIPGYSLGQRWRAVGGRARSLSQNCLRQMRQHVSACLLFTLHGSCRVAFAFCRTLMHWRMGYCSIHPHGHAQTCLQCDY